ncbi:MAG: SPOR domain-containing protein [Spirochaetaceae bacterium]|nr:SPOR domain-containing protein [Spirochaetaceae bacterium]
MKRAFLVFGFVCAAVAAYAGPREVAAEREKRGDREGAITAYEEWLAANASASDFTEVLFHAADLHPRLAGGIALLEKYRAAKPDKAAESAILGKTATLYEVSGSLAKAAALFEQAYAVNPGEASFPFLYRAARILFEMGETQKSEDLARLISNLCKNPVTKKRAAFLLTRILAAKGSREEAMGIAMRLTEDTANPADNENIFLFIFTLADSLGRETERSLALRNLAKDYPDSPEFRLASRAAGQSRSAAVTPLPTPSALLNPFSAMEGAAPSPAVTQAGATGAETKGAASPPPAAAQAAPSATAVQTGSFSVRENADYMVRDLRSRGFAAEIREAADRTGNPVYRVVVPIAGGGPDEAQKLLMRLKEKSIEGFLLF